MKKPIISVVGSINMDLIVTTQRRPAVGETIIGSEFYTKPGGKGANQAVAAARLGAEVHMIGRVGDDIFGNELLSLLNKENIFLNNVEPVTHMPTGVASITLSEGDNNIIIVPGANSLVTPEYIHQHIETILKSDVIIAQLEIPIETVEELSIICSQYKKALILNPAPAQQLTTNVISNCTYITPNEIELNQLKEQHPNMLEEYEKKLIVTEGKKGSYYLHQGEIQRVKGFAVNAVDTTGAGDCFNGALAYSLGLKKDIAEASRFANAAAALSVQKLGAQEGMPTLKEVEQFLARYSA